MFISYPLGHINYDDNQAAQIYLMDELISGNWMIGNVRYSPGYALVMAPFKAITDKFGSLDTRIFLAIQLALYSTIPFMVYDIIRRRYTASAAFIVALVVLLDPFALQWAHFRLPGWLIALLTIFAFWLSQLAWDSTRRRRFLLVGLASVALGFTTFARFNYAPLVAIFGVSFFLWRHIPLLERFTLFVLVGLISAGILGTYIIGIHIPSTGTTTLSCVAGNNFATGLLEKNIPMRASNGPKSDYYAKLLTLPAQRETVFYSWTYRLWKNPDSWVKLRQKEKFLAQPFGTPKETITTVFPAALYWYLGPCDADAMLMDVYQEAVALQALKLILEITRSTALMLIQHPSDTSFDHQYLPSANDIEWIGENQWGFQRANGDYYNGHIVWRPGIDLYSAIFSGWNLIKFLSPLGVIWGVWRRDWFYVTVSSILVIGLILIATAARMEPRYYSMLAPLFSILIGGFLYWVWQRWKNRKQA